MVSGVTHEQALTTTATPAASAGRDFFTGVGFLLRGIGTYARSPKIMLMGLIPAVISGLLLIGAFVAMVFFVGDVVRWATPFIDDWSTGTRDTLRFVVMLAVAAVWMVLSVLVFAALTLAVGQPFYEAISKRVEDQLGGVPNEVDVKFWRNLPRSIFDSVRLLVVAGLFSIIIFAIGVVPVVGTIIAGVLGASLGGWILALELSGVPFERRGMRLKQRRKMLRTRRPMALGFGVATFLCFLIPLGAVLVMPAAVVGATLLSRRLFGQPDVAAR
jgi:CysZ protein